MTFRLSLFILMTLLSQGVFADEVTTKETSSKGYAPIEVIFETSKGSFTLELTPEKAPITVANFLTYVDDGFYNNTIYRDRYRTKKYSQ